MVGESDMENKNTDVGFNYTYSAIEQDEIRKIREKYQPKKEDDMSKLRKLDAEVTNKATINSLIIGIMGALVMGTGMSFVMTDLGTVFRLQGNINLVVGIIVGIVGLVLIGMAYPMYKKVLEKEREKVAPEILKLTEELMK